MTYLRTITDPVTKLGGVGPAATGSYAELGIHTQSELLLLAPRTWEDRSTVRPLGSVQDGQVANTLVEVLSHSYFGLKKGMKRTLKIIVRDVSGLGDGRLSLLCFGRNFLEKTIKPGRIYYLWAPVAIKGSEKQAVQFELHPATEDGDFPPQFGKILPVYPLRGSLTQRLIRANIRQVLTRCGAFINELPESLMKELDLLSTDEAIRAYHFPPNLQQLARARRTLAFTELFYLQLVARRKPRKKTAKPAIPGDLELRLIERLPFTLTNDQLAALKEIREDLGAEEPMNRLLQGDVGSGKTLIGWISALKIIAEGGQVAFMAPTELLARQHAESGA
ncbi:MAG: DNA helicase RecG, partial [Spirochaetales bacterium]|nr:DNA helicase RecG [Spirochaetales bacterium]